MYQYYTYILASWRNGTLYVGVTDNLIRRIQEHKAGTNDWFTKKYNVNELVWYSPFGSIYDAIIAEKRIKKWKREYKINTIEIDNPAWRDLYNEIIQ